MYLIVISSDIITTNSCGCNLIVKISIHFGILAAYCIFTIPYINLATLVLVSLDPSNGSVNDHISCQLFCTHVYMCSCANVCQFYGHKISAVRKITIQWNSYTRTSSIQTNKQTNIERNRHNNTWFRVRMWFVWWLFVRDQIFTRTIVGKKKG